MKHLFTIILSTLFVSQLVAQDDILDLRNNYPVGSSVTITGIVTNGDEMGSSVRYIQDESAGIAIYPGADWSDWGTAPLRGDEITVSGEVTEFNGLLEVGPDLTDVTINSSDNPLPDPQVVTPGQLGEDREGEIVQVNMALFSSGGGDFEANSTYTFVANDETGTAYVRAGSVLVGDLIPVGSVTLTGILSQFTFDGFGGYQILPRDQDDIFSSSPINIASTISQDDIATTSFSLNWITDVEGSTRVEYGLSPDNLNEEVESTDPTTDHDINLDGLEPGTIYYAKAISENNDGSAESGVQPFATKSLSSGEITVYFNGSVDHSMSSGEEAISLGEDMNDSLAAVIDRADHTLDMAIYNINDQTMVNAVNDAYDRGVEIRYIAQGSNANIGVDQFNPNIPVLYREDNNGSGMHNKFIIVDADYTDKATVVTGATNLTTAQLIEDYNNAIIFQDESLCKGFRLEFNEMWGSDGPTPDMTNSVFGSDKLINTPEKFIVGDVPVELYFSPTDNATGAIQRVIESTDDNLYFALLAFTRDELGQAVIDVNNNFFSTAVGMVEMESTTGSEFGPLQDAGVAVYSHQGISPLLHHKYAIVDICNEANDPIVVTGSHNWSSSAENVNDENIVVVHSERVTNLYFQEFAARLSDLGINILDVDNSILDCVVGVNELENEITLTVFPNPTNDVLNVSTVRGGDIKIYDLLGNVVWSGRANSQNTVIDVSMLSQGLYAVELIHDGQRITTKVVVE